MQNEEITKHMIRTPYGILTMSTEIYYRFRNASESMQWIQLYKAVKRGNFLKAQAMQWIWSMAEWHGGF